MSLSPKDGARLSSRTQIHLDLQQTAGAIAASRKKHHVTGSYMRSPDYVKPETVQYNCISAQLNIKHELTWLWVKTNAPEAIFYRAFHHQPRRFSVYRYTLNTLHCTTLHTITASLTHPSFRGRSCVAETPEFATQKAVKYCC